MKTKFVKKLMLLLGISLAFLSGCIYNSDAESETIGYSDDESGYIYNPDAESETEAYSNLMPIYSDGEIVFFQSKKISESLPTFDFYIRSFVGDEKAFNFHEYPFEHPFSPWAEPWTYGLVFTEIELIVKKDGEIIQVIGDMYVIFPRIRFQDFNFDGYLDLQIESHQAFSEGHMLYSYFFIWDTEINQFILNKQLMEIGYAASIYANAETNKIEVWHRTVPYLTLILYSYYGGVFVAHGTEIAHPPINIKINESLPEFAIHRVIGEVVDEWWEPRFDVRLEIWSMDGKFIQEIAGLVQGASFIYLNAVAIEGMGNYPIHRSDHTFEFADLNFDGYLDMMLRSSRDTGGVGNILEQYFFLWDIENSMFVLNEQLMEISNGKFDVYVNRETRQIEAWGLSEIHFYTDFYLYNDGVFIKAQESVAMSRWVSEE